MKYLAGYIAFVAGFFTFEQPQQFHATSVAINILNNNTKIYSAPTFGKGFPLDYFHSHQSFIQHPLAVINKPIETSTFHPNPPQKKESKKKIILLRVIPTMTCRVGVVRWGLLTFLSAKQAYAAFLQQRFYANQSPSPSPISPSLSLQHAWDPPSTPSRFDAEEDRDKIPFEIPSLWLQPCKQPASVWDPTLKQKESFETLLFSQLQELWLQPFDEQLQQNRTQLFFNTRLPKWYVSLQLAVRPAHKPLIPTHPVHVIAPGSIHTKSCKHIKHTELNSRALQKACIPNHNHETHWNN